MAKSGLKYCYAETLASGTTRHRVQRIVDGERRRITIYGEPGTPEFKEQYHRALKHIEEGTKQPKTGYADGTLGWLITIFLITMENRQTAGLLSSDRLNRYRRHLGMLMAAKTRSGRPAAQQPAAMPRREFIRIRDTLLQTPAAADSFTAIVARLYNWAKKEDVFEALNPAEKVDRIDARSSGHAIWTTDEVRLYLECHEKGTLARLAMVLELCTAARRGDLIRLGPDNVKTLDGTDWLKWRQEKPPHVSVEIPVMDMLRDELFHHAPDGERYPSGAAFIQNSYGKPFAKGTFSNNFAAWCDAAGIPKRLHGVRKGLASILAELGVAEYGIDILLGHELGSGSSRIYTKGARRRELARDINKQWNKIDW